jgi:Domain of unknown function (DUF1844)
MTQSPEEGFKVTDRRRRDDEEPLGRDTTPRETAASRPSAEHRSLVDLFMMLANEAVVALGDAPDPASGQHEQILPHAAEVIDLLLLLREKTEGNRTEEETQILEQLLYDLQLRYVRATKSAG